MPTRCEDASGEGVIECPATVQIGYLVLNFFLLHQALTILISAWIQWNFYSPLS